VPRPQLAAPNSPAAKRQRLQAGLPNRFRIV
jgi:hypothetical protein